MIGLRDIYDDDDMCVCMNIFDYVDGGIYHIGDVHEDMLLLCCICMFCFGGLTLACCMCGSCL